MSEKEHLDKIQRVSFKEFSFFDGTIKGFNHRLIIMINEQFSGIYNSFVKLGFENSSGILRKLGYDLGINMSQMISDKILDAKIGFEYLLLMLNKAGYGKFWHLEFTDEDITLELHNSSEAYDNNIPSCFYIAGILEGLGEHFFNEKVQVIEKSCISEGNPFCEFLIMKREKYLNELEKRAELELILRDFDNTAKSKGSLIIKQDGNIMVHSINQDIDKDTFSLLLSTILTASNAASSYLTGEYIQTIINCAQGTIMIMPIQNKGFLAAILDKNSSPNLIGIAMRSGTDKILKVLGSK